MTCVYLRRNRVKIGDLQIIDIFSDLMLFDQVPVQMLLYTLVSGRHKEQNVS